MNFIEIFIKWNLETGLFRIEGVTIYIDLLIPNSKFELPRFLPPIFTIGSNFHTCI